MDGTLVDNMRFHSEAWVALSKRLGVEVSPERFEHEFAGRKNEEILPIILGRDVPRTELEELAREKEQHYRTLYRPHLALLPGAEALLTQLQERGTRLAVATAAPPENRELVLEGLGISRYFDVIVGPEMGVRGKPFPDIFLAAAKKLQVLPDTCLVFEDALNGVKAGVAAGMPVAAVTTTTSASLLRAAGAQWTMKNFLQLPEDLAAALV